ncbi:MAG: repeat/fibronectin type domain protein [Acidobacteriaceae bacterium]|nr:repeat/fibronectin type domain protein [Acidobacteriaceae bacterium]
MLNQAPPGIRALVTRLSAGLLILSTVLVAQSAFGALATDTITSTDRSSQGSSVSSSSFSTKFGNELLLAFISTDASSSGITVTGVSGAGLTWALVRRTNGQMGTAEIWRAYTSSALSAVAVQATLSQNVAASMTIVTVIGVDTSGTNGSGAIGNTNGNSASSGAPSVSLITTRDGSWVFGVGTDWDKATARTLGTNQSVVHQYLATVGDTYWIQKQNTPTALSGTQVFISDTAPTTDRFNLSIVEVLAATGGATTGSVSGTISPAPNGTTATIVLSQNGTTVATTTAGSSGSYSFSNVANGTYTVTPSEAGFTFSPANQSVTVNGNAATVSVFTATAVVTTFTVSGTITPAPNGTTATVVLSQSGATVATTTVGSSGSYSFSNVANGTYTVTPSETGFTFSPANQSVTVNGNPATVPAFTATAVVTTFTVSGTISPAPNGVVATVTLSQSGTTVATATVGSSGSYSFSSVSNGTYTVTPSETGFTFSPASQSVPVNGADVTVPVFTATAVTSGGIQPVQKNVAGNEATGLNISATFPSNNTAGNFLIVAGTAARPGSTLTITDTLGNTYIPAIGPVTDSNQKVTAYIWYVPNCKGGANTVTLTPSTADALEIHVTEWSGIAISSSLDQTASAAGTGTAASSGSMTTTLNGELIFGYTFLLNTAVAGNGFTGISLVNGDLDEYQIQSTAGPIAATFTQTSGTWLALMATFEPASSGTIGSWTISGNISGAGGNGAVVTLSSGSSTIAATTANSTGAYAFNNIGSGSYTVTPTNAGYTLNPVSQAVSVTNANISNVNFTATASSTWSISGNISPSSLGSGAVLTLSGSNSTTTADANGNYSFANVANGMYTVTPSQAGVTFNPAWQSVTVNGAPLSTVNFTAQTIATGALAIDATVYKDATSKASTITTPTFSTISGNELLLAFVSTDYSSGANTTVTGISGGSLTWALVKRTNAQSGTAEIWEALAASPLSGVAVTATLSQSVLSSMTVVSFTGADPSGSNGSGAIGAIGGASASSGAPTATLTTTRNNSWVFGVGNDFDKAIARTVGSGQTLVHQILTSSGDTYWVQRQTTTTPVSGTAVKINDTAPTGDRYNLSIAEVLPSLSGGGGTPPTVSITAPAAGATVTGNTTVSATASSQGSAITGVQFVLDQSNFGAQVTSTPYSITWDTTTATAGAHTLSAIAYNSVGLSTTANSITVTVDNSGNLAAVGSWSAPVNLPAVAVNLVLLKNNSLLFYQDGSTPTVWDYINNVFTSVPAPADLFCSGQTMLADGRILIVGGYGGSGNQFGIPNAELFDPSNNTWTILPKMAYSRWYPTATTLSDGRVIVMGGWQTSNHTNAGIPEIYDPVANTWTKLTNANNPFETYPFIYQLSDGRLIHVNGSEYATITDILNLNTQSWSTVDPNIKDGGSSVMYMPDKIMKAGSAADSQMTGPSSNTTYVLDMTKPSPAWQQTASMANLRSFLNLTELPDGTVLATGGETDKNGGNISNAVYAAELWSPLTQTWTTMASMHTPREYHSTALLLPDGRVLQSGMGADFGSVPDETSAEFYSPPYLFKGARPTITQAPAQISYGQNFFVGTPDGSTITSAVLIRTGAVTHFFNMNARFVPVTFTTATGGLTITAPANGNLAPPGYYMLFVLNSNGVPSIAPFVQLQ